MTVGDLMIPGLPYIHHHEAVKKFGEMQINGDTLADFIIWLFDNDWYFQTESGAWDNTTMFHHPSNLDALLTDLPDSITFNNNIKFEIVDSYIYFRSKSMNPNMTVMLKHGGSPEADWWPNDVIQTEIRSLFWLAQHHHAINKKVINK